MARITRKPKGAYHHGNLRDGIVAAASRVVDDEGTSALTIRQVADRLGVSHAAIYHHFADRTAMLAAVAEAALHRVGDAMSASPASSPLERFRAVGVAYVLFALEHPHLYAAMFGPDLEARHRHAGLVAARARVFQLIRAAIAACQREGIIKAGSADEHTLFCWSAVHGLASLVSERQTGELALPSSRAKLVDIVIERVFTGLAAPTLTES